MDNKNRKPKKPSNSTIYGFHPVIEALEAGRAVEKVLLRKASQHARRHELQQKARDAGVPVQQVPDVRLRKVARTDNHQGVVALLSPIEYAPLEETILRLQEQGISPLLIMLDGVTDVRNLGAIARSAECLGAHALIIPSRGGAAINADALKTSVGALHHLPVCRENNLVDSILLLQAYGITCLACTEKGKTLHFEANMTGPICLIMGSEEKGISNQILKRADHLIQIPMTGEIASLNVSVASGIILAEASRQRYQTPK